MRLCECGCGQTTTTGRRFVHGHGRRRPLAAMYDVVDLGYETACWLWNGRLNSHGYGARTIDGRRHSAHRLTYEASRGAVPPGLELDHLCRIPACVNPDHLEAVDHIENVRRGAAQKFSDATIAEIRERAAAALGPNRRRRPDGFTRALAEEYGIGYSYMKRILAGSTPRQTRSVEA